MCLPGCRELVAAEISRRGLLKMLAAATATVAAAPLSAAEPESVAPGGFDRVVDLTHPLGPDFPTFTGEPQLEIERVSSFRESGYNANVWHLHEHTGTHMDAPAHFSDADTADEIPLSRLVVPLAVIDLRAKAAQDADAQVTPEDVRAWEERHGRLPGNACVAMLSGWAEKVATDGFRNADEQGGLHFPGFHPETAAFLIEERDVVGVAVDTLSLDHGASPDFAFHRAWLPSDRWGMECVAALDQVPASGATLVAAGPKIRGASGGPSRVIALFQS